MQVNNAGIRGVDVDGDVSVLEEYIEADSASFMAGGQVCFYCTNSYSIKLENHVTITLFMNLQIYVYSDMMEVSYS